MPDESSKITGGYDLEKLIIADLDRAMDAFRRSQDKVKAAKKEIQRIKGIIEQMQKYELFKDEEPSTKPRK